LCGKGNDARGKGNKTHRGKRRGKKEYGKKHSE